MQTIYNIGQGEETIGRDSSSQEDVICLNINIPIITVIANTGWEDWSVS